MGAEGLLGDVQPGGGPGKILFLGYGQEIFHGEKIQEPSLSL